MNIDELKKISSFSIETDKSTSIDSDKLVFRIRFRTIDGKMHRLSPTKHPQFTTKDEARDWVKKKEAFVAGEKSRIQKIKANNEMYPMVGKKVDCYIEYKRTDSKKKIKEFKTIQTYFNTYILKFFLVDKGLSEFEAWSNAHDDFLIYLENVKSTRSDTSLSNETRRKICFYLNEFYSWLFTKKFVDHQLDKIEVPAFIDNRKVLEESYWKPSEFESLLKLASNELRDVSIFLYNTGYRTNEMMGCSRTDYHPEKLSVLSLDNIFNSLKIEYKGYLLLRYQLDKIEDGICTFAPLKSRKAILPRFYRYIPCSKPLYDIIVQRNNTIFDKYGDLPVDRQENLLFGDISLSKLNAELKVICRTLGLPPRSLHSYRHTFTTNLLITLNLDKTITRMITGHESEKVFERYNHLVELLKPSNQSSRHGRL